MRRTDPDSTTPSGLRSVKGRIPRRWRPAELTHSFLIRIYRETRVREKDWTERERREGRGRGEERSKEREATARTG